MAQNQRRWRVICRMLVVAFVGCGFMSAAHDGWTQEPAPNDKEKEAWHGTLALGMTLTRGNSDTFQLNTTVLARKLLPRDEFRFGVEFNYALNDFTRSNQTTSSENVHGFGDYKHLFTDRFYGDARIDAFHDGPADVKYRVNLGPAAGYYFIKSDASRFNLELGPGYQIVKQDSEEQQYATLRISERCEHSFNKTVKVWEEVDYFPQVDKFDNYLVLSEAGVEAALSTRLSLRVVCQDKYNSQPSSGYKNNDVTLITSIGWKY